MGYIDKVKFYLFIIEGFSEVNGCYKKVKRKFKQMYFTFGQDEYGLYVKCHKNAYCFELGALMYLIDKNSFSYVYGAEAFCGDMVESVVKLLFHNLDLSERDFIKVYQSQN